MLGIDQIDNQSISNNTENVFLILILLVEFGDEFQIASRQILGDPLVDASVQIWAEVVLPVASLAFANKRVSFVGETGLDLHRHVD